MLLPVGIALVGRSLPVVRRHTLQCKLLVEDTLLGGVVVVVALFGSLLVAVVHLTSFSVRNHSEALASPPVTKPFLLVVFLNNV